MSVVDDDVGVGVERSMTMFGVAGADSTLRWGPSLLAGGGDLSGGICLAFDTGAAVGSLPPL